MNWILRPYEAIGPFRLGMSRQLVRESINLPPNEFNKWGQSEPTDHFAELGVLVYYLDGVVEGIEAGSPARVAWDGVDLIGAPYRDVRATVLARDPDAELDGAGLISRSIGIAIYASSAEKHPDLPVEGVMVFRRGYYDNP